MLDHPLSEEERIALLERLKRLSQNPSFPAEDRAGLFRVIRLLSNVIAYWRRKRGQPDADYRIHIH